MGPAGAATGLSGEGGGGEVHGPEEQAGGGVVEAAGVDEAQDFDAVEGHIAPVDGDAKPGDRGEATGTGHVAEAGPGVEVVAAARAAAGCKQRRPVGRTWRQVGMIRAHECMETSAGHGSG